MTGLLDVVPGPAFVPHEPDEKVLARGRKLLGPGMPDGLEYLTSVPWVVDLVLDVVASPAYATDPVLVNLAKWAAAHENSCRYCFGAQRSILKLTAFDDAFLDRLEQDAEAASVDPKQRRVLDLARKLARSNPRPARAEREALAQTYGAQAAVELAYVIAGACAMNRVTTFLRLPPNTAGERFTRRWYIPLLRPFFRRMIHRPPPPPKEGPLAGPFAPVLEAMGPLPVTHVVRGAIDRALASPHLPRRTKLLAFAVVARSMPCATCEAECRRLLAEEGIAGDELDEILKSLGSPKLDPLEKLIVPFARATVRYQFLEVQDQVALLAPKMTAPQLIETVGICSLANMIVRLAMLG